MLRGPSGWDHDRFAVGEALVGDARIAARCCCGLGAVDGCVLLASGALRFMRAGCLAMAARACVVVRRR